ncbi:hypothetical protein LEMLEM_LOCUS20396 [Lemmus lemmus]
MTATRQETCEPRWRCRASPTARVSLPQPSPSTSRGTGAHAHASAPRGRFPFKIILVSSDPYGFRAAFPQCNAAERLGSRGGAAAGIRAEAAAAAGSGLRRARGVGPCGCRAGRTSAAARATGASTWGTFRPTCERRTWRTCFTSTAASARSSSRTGMASCPSPSSASRIRGMLKMQFMEEMVMIMASVDFVWNSPGLTEVGVGGPVVQGMGLLQDDLISEFLFQGN